MSRAAGHDLITDHDPRTDDGYGADWHAHWIFAVGLSVSR
jgi:hypothetical protein